MASTTVEDQVAYHTGKAGDIVRQLGLAGVAVVWLFHSSALTPSQHVTLGHFVPYAVPNDFFWPLFLIIGALALDALHYLAGSILWGTLLWKEKGTDGAATHRCAFIAMMAFVIAKVSVMGFALAWLLCSLHHHITSAL